MTKWLSHHKVAAIEPTIAVFEHVVEQLLFRFLLVGIAVKRILLVYFHNQQAGFPKCQFIHGAIGRTHNFVFGNIIFHNGPCFIIARRPAAGFVKIEYVDKGAIAFRRAIKFVNSVNAKAVFERHPNIGAQAITQDFDNLMIAVIGLFGLGQQIAQQFANVTKRRRTIAAAFMPERAGAEFAPNSQRRATHQCA